MDHYAVIGHPIKHSLSPLVHEAFAKQTHQQLSYTKIEAPLDGFEETVTDFIAQGGKGANVTLPFKEQAYHFATQRSDLAQQAKAANTLVFGADQSIYAESTDGIGLVRDLTHNHQFNFSNRTVLLLGAGGAVRTILGPLLHLNPAQLIIANRTKNKAVALVSEFSSLGNDPVIKAIGLDEFPNQSFDLIINATSVGLTGKPFTLPAHLISASHTWCYDLMYGLDETPFIHWAKQFNPAMALDGLGMLVEQAAASFNLWRGIYPETKPVIEKLRSKLF